MRFLGFLLQVLAEQQRDIADALNQCRGAVVAELSDDVVPRIPVADPYADLDEFVMVERRFVFGEHRVAQAGIADHDQRFELVTEAAQVLFLVFTEIHGREV